jgi:hypothetical protein
VHALKLVAVDDNALPICKPGTGESHVAKAIAYQAVLLRYRVQYLETDDFFNRYALGEAAERKTRPRSILDCDLRFYPPNTLPGCSSPRAPVDLAVALERAGNRISRVVV